MKLRARVFRVIAFALLVNGALAQNSGQHYAKDGLSFDYPAGWSIDESKTTGQMQYLTLGRDGFAMIIVRSPRAVIDTPEKETHAKQLIQDGFIEAWANNFSSQGSKAERSTVTTEIGGGPGECTRLSASLSGEQGRVDICWRLLEKHMVQLAIVGSTKDVTKSAPAWDMIRNSLKVESLPEAKPSPKVKP
jgi:hypothetical protein